MALELTIQGVEAGYKAVRALHGISLTIREKETVALLGTNGNGKSTLMKCVMGMVRPTQGSLILKMDGATHDLTKLSTEEIVNLGVAMVPEGRRLFPKLTVEENLLLGAFRPLARGEIAKNLSFSYEIFPLLAERRRQLAGSMSGGQQQMLAIARALMSRPKLILFDEPSLGLAPNIVERTFDIITGIRNSGTTVLMVEQNALAALEMCDHAYLLESGSIALSGSGRELVDNPHVRSAYLAG